MIIDKVIIGIGLIVVGVAGWWVTDGLSSDAISMALGVLFGILAGLPVALVMIGLDRQREQTQPTPSVQNIYFIVEGEHVQRISEGTAKRIRQLATRHGDAHANGSQALLQSREAHHHRHA